MGEGMRETLERATNRSLDAETGQLQGAAITTAIISGRAREKVSDNEEEDEKERE
jgi:hypothetical protein